jgi:hypothetical protein
MAQWWELTIPAAATLAGGLIGAWAQARGSARQQRWQSSEARAQRREQERRDSAVRYFAERRQAYADFGKSIYDVSAAAYDVTRYGHIPPPEAAPAETIARLEVARREAFDALTIAAQAVRAALVPLQLVGSEEQAALGNQIADEASGIMEAGGGGDLVHMQNLLQSFFERGRLELMSANQPVEPAAPDDQH